MMRRAVSSSQRALRRVSSSISSTAKLSETQPCLLCQHHLSSRIQPSRAHAATSQTRCLSGTSFRASSTYTQSNQRSIRQRESLAPQTHYEIFPQTLPAGPPPSSSFAIDLSSLRKEFLQLQTKAHPDKFPTGPQKSRAEALSARINEAYKTLMSPLHRAQYLLSLHEIDVMSESQGTAAQDPDTLMVVLDVQERLEEGDLEPADLERMKAENGKRVRKSERVLGELIEAGRWEDAGREAIRLKYWMNVKEGLDDWEPGSGGVVLVH